MQLIRARRLALGALGALGALAALVACGSSSFSTTIEGAGGGRGGVSRPSSDFGTSGGASADQPRCPPDPPAEGSACNVPGVPCGYGPDIREECLETYACEDGSWSRTASDCVADCPKTIDGIALGAPCADDRVACSYDEGTCGCVSDETATPPPAPDAAAGDAASDGGSDAGASEVRVPGTWKCVAPPTTVGCPSARPRELDACVKTVTCDYGSCELGRRLVYSCAARVWSGPDVMLPCDP